MCGILPRVLAVPVVGGTSVPTGEYPRGAFVRRSRGVRLPDPRCPFPVPCLPGCHVDIAPVPVASATDAASRVVSVPRSAPAGRATHPPDLPGMHVRPGQPREYREARAVIVGVNLRDSYAGNDTTVGGSKGRHIARNDRPWPEPTVGIGAATAAGTPGICRPSQGVACALAARQRALPASTPHHGFFRRIRGLRGVSGRLLSPHSRRMQSVLWESTVVQPRQAKPKAGRHPPSSGLKSLPQCIR